MNRTALQSKSATTGSTAVAPGLLLRKCACGSQTIVGGECDECKKKRLELQRNSVDAQSGPTEAPPIVDEVLRSPGQPLDPATRAFMEPRFGHDFSSVRVHTDAKAAGSARAVNSLAYTVGRDVVFGAGQYAPTKNNGKALLAHELAHTIQQSAFSHLTSTPNYSLATTTADRFEAEADQAAMSIEQRPERPIRATGLSAPALQRQSFHTPLGALRSPPVEETVTQLTTAMRSSPLTLDEIALAQTVFGDSIDYAKVRIIHNKLLEYPTISNHIYVPFNFTIKDRIMAHRFIHEMAHVWQYHHGGTSYISISLWSQFISSVQHHGAGIYSREFAYGYTLESRSSFFDFTPEQQAQIVQNYFLMLRDKADIERDVATGSVYPLRRYSSNHHTSSGKPGALTADQRLAEISLELPMHERLIDQMRSALPKKDMDILMLRATEVIQIPGEELSSPPQERRLAPVKPVFELNF